MQGLREKLPTESGPCRGELRLAGDSNNSQQRLLRGYLHKTSNSLCGIKGYASLIAGLGQDAGDNERWARKIIGEVEKMERVFASVDEMTAKRKTENPDCDPVSVLESCLAAVLPRHPHLAVSLGSILPGRLMLPAADLTQVLKDVLDNAAEGPDGHPGRVCVRISSEVSRQGRISLIIRDDAGGIPLHLGSQVQDPFVSGKPGHLGIGLSRVETILDIHGLDWSLESSHEQGTTVTMEVAAPEFAAVTLAGKASDGA